MTKAQDNITLIRKGFEAFNKGDVATLKQVLSPDCVQHMSGSNRFSGDHKGLDNVLEMYGEIGTLTNGTFQAVLGDVHATDHGVTAQFTSTATRTAAASSRETQWCSRSSAHRRRRARRLEPPASPTWLAHWKSGRS